MSDDHLPGTNAWLDEEHRYRSIVDHLLDPLLGWNLRGVITFANPAAERLFRAPGRAILGTALPRLQVPEEHMATWAALHELLAEPRTSIRECRMETADGPRWYQWQDIPVLDPAGEPLAFHSIGRDISAHRHLEAELQESEARYRALFESSQTPMFLVDPAASRFVDANEAAVLFYGYPRAAFQEGMPVSGVNLLPPEEIAAALRRATETRLNQFQFRHRLASGEIRDVEVFSGPIRINGQALLYSIVHDITERTQAVEALRRSEAKYRIVAEELNEGLGVTDAEGRYTYVNPELQRMLGYTQAEMLGMTPLDLAFPEDRERVAARLRQREFPRRERHELRIRRKDGSAMDARLSIAPLHGSHGEFLGLIGLVSDLTETRRNAEVQSRAQKLESLSLMAGGVAHDFNNLFQSMQAHLEIAMQHLADPSRVAHCLTNARRILGRAAHLAGRILDYSGRSLWHPQPVRLSTFLERNHGLLAGQVAQATLEVAVAQDLPAIEADPDQFLQVLAALLANADEALGGRPGLVCLGAERIAVGEDDRRIGFWAAPFPGTEAVRIEVADTGPGIPTEHLPQLFDPFFTTKELGRGLGLPAVLGILRNNHAGIQVLNQRGGGASFRLYFPPRPDASEQAQGASGTQAAARNGTILLVDDDADLRDTLKEVLFELLQYPVLCAQDGQEAIDRYREHRDSIALILMDATMPRLGGGEAYEAIKQIDPAARAILISGFSREVGLEEVRRHGFASFLKKPFSIPELKHAIEGALGARA